jgi:RHS repeat-associated protein
VSEGATATTSLYFGEVEIVNPEAGVNSDEVVKWYPHPNVRITRERGLPPQVGFLHRDQLDSVVLIAGDLAAEVLERIYEPFGSDTEYGIPGREDKGFIGERKDAVAGLQYLNARYYDPELGMFIQPDWFEVTLTGVGTNRYSYSLNDPVNLRDPGGNNPAFGVVGGWIAGLFGGATAAEVGLGSAVVGVGVATAIDSISNDNAVFSDSGDDGPGSDDQGDDESSGSSPDPDDEETKGHLYKLHLTWIRCKFSG